jgi:cell division protein FtsW
VRGFWLGIFALVLLGILLQPNLSTTALCGMTLWLIALAGGLPYSYLGGTALGGLLLGFISLSIKEYQRRRVMSFLNPWSDPMNDGYQLIQSLLAVGSGGTWGSGFGLSQQKLFYLPIQYTDFIFAVFAEEFGFAGSVLMMAMIMTYATLAVIVAMKARNKVHQLIAIGAMILIVGQSLLNIGVATGLLPTTGLPFPFFSYGGSSMIASFVAAGLLIRVARESSEAEIVSIEGRRQSAAERREQWRKKRQAQRS